MLARLKSVVLTLDGTRTYVPDEEMKSVPEDEAMVVDVQYLRGLMPVPDTASWWRVAGMCGQAISPVYRGFQGILLEDIDRVAEVLSQVGYDREEEDNAHEGRCTKPSMAASQLPVDLSHLKPPAEFDKFPEKPRRKRRRSSNTDRCLPLIIPSTHPSAPTIIITPCPPEPMMTEGHVPYQDHAHGLKLTVPAHPAFNATFPPMAPSPYILPLVSKWKWQDGHWQALLPDLEEQAKNGMYSRAVTVKNKPCRRPLRLTNSN